MGFLWQNPAEYDIFRIVFGSFHLLREEKVKKKIKKSMATSPSCRACETQPSEPVCWLVNQRRLFTYK